MSRLDRITQWTAGGTSLRKLDRAGAGDPAEQPHGPNMSGYVTGDDLEAELGRGHGIWAGAEDDDDGLPGERLQVYRSKGCWRDDKGQLRVTVHGFASEAAYARGECVIGQGSLWQEAAALSFAALPSSYFHLPEPPLRGVEFRRRNPHDVRPELLLLMHAEDLRALPKCLKYGVNYLTAWCLRAGVVRSEPAKLAAAGDALSLLFRTRASREAGRVTGRPNTPALAERSKQLGMRNSEFAKLRSLMASVYRRRLREAEEQFSLCADYIAPKTGESQGCGFAPESWWRPERSPPTDS